MFAADVRDGPSPSRLEEPGHDPHDLERDADTRGRSHVTVPFEADRTAGRFDTYDLVNRWSVSHRYRIADGSADTARSPHRFV